MNASILSGAEYWSLIKGGTANLYANRAEINDLNVFPIPDGDTGDNMYMTIRSGLQASDGSGTLGDVSSRIARGMLMGARGNSGVILSRIFSGIAEGFADSECADGEVLLHALQMGIDKAYGAVTTPVEGTILTVYREAAEYVRANARPGFSLRESLSLLCEEAARSLERTPDLLAVLKEAHVVDSGGAGLLCILQGMLSAVEGKDVTVAPEKATASAQTVDFSLFTEDSVLEYGYCTEFILRLQRSKVDLEAFDIDAFTAHLSAIGESVVSFRDGSLVKVHIHTRTPAEILTYGQQFGEFLTIKIENMTLQHNGVKHKEEVAATPVAKPRKPHKAYAVVAVATGEGIVETFRSMGADAVIDGGQCMNPSASQFIEAFESINADTILVFPGNSNIILTARQAAELYKGADVRVIPCKSVCETYAALSVLDTSSGDTDAILDEVTGFLGEVVSAGVSRANKDTELGGVAVHSGDFIGHRGSTVLSDHPDCVVAAQMLAERLEVEKYGLLLLICGKDANAEEAERLYRYLTDTYRRTEIIMLDGGQPVHDYLLLLE